MSQAFHGFAERSRWTTSCAIINLGPLNVSSVGWPTGSRRWWIYYLCWVLSIFLSNIETRRLTVATALQSSLFSLPTLSREIRISMESTHPARARVRAEVGLFCLLVPSLSRQPGKCQLGQALMMTCWILTFWRGGGRLRDCDIDSDAILPNWCIN